MNRKGKTDMEGVLILITVLSFFFLIIMVQLFSCVNDELKDIKKRATNLNIAKIIVLPENSSYLLFNGESAESVCNNKK